MSDLIKRHDAITAFCEHECGKGMTREKCGAVDCGTIFDDIPSAQPEQVAIANVQIDEEELKRITKDALKGCKIVSGWIPCSERLPETTDEVLTTYIVNGNRKKRFVETATYYDGDDGYWSSPWDEYRVFGTRVDVIAWMPLPEPYKEV